MTEPPNTTTHLYMILQELDTITACLQSLVTSLRNPINVQYDTLLGIVQDWQDEKWKERQMPSGNLPFEAVAVARSLVAIDHTLESLGKTLKTVRENLVRQGMTLREDRPL